MWPIRLGNPADATAMGPVGRLAFRQLADRQWPQDPAQQAEGDAQRDLRGVTPRLMPVLHPHARADQGCQRQVRDQAGAGRGHAGQSGHLHAHVLGMHRQREHDPGDQPGQRAEQNFATSDKSNEPHIARPVAGFG